MAGLWQKPTIVNNVETLASMPAIISCAPPAGEGTPQILKTLNRIWQGQGRPGDLEFLERLGKTMMEASFCPLGQIAPAPLFSLLKNFRRESEDHISGKCQAGVCRVS